MAKTHEDNLLKLKMTLDAAGIKKDHKRGTNKIAKITSVRMYAKNGKPMVMATCVLDTGLSVTRHMDYSDYLKLGMKPTRADRIEKSSGFMRLFSPKIAEVA